MIRSIQPRVSWFHSNNGPSFNILDHLQSMEINANPKVKRKLQRDQEWHFGYLCGAQGQSSSMQYNNNAIIINTI